MEWLNDPNSGKYFVLASIIFFATIEFFLGHFKETQRTKDDWLIEVLGFILLTINSTVVLLGIIYIGETYFPNGFNALSHWSIWLALPFYMLIDDLAQYWYHRLSHENNWMWKHHRPHHAAEEMGISVTYRNSWIYFLFLPNIWWAALCTFWGLVPATVLGLIIKQSIVASSHSTFKWDTYFYQIPILKPIIALLERIIVTPAFHYVHHGKSKADGVSDPNGNFGNAFSIWDQLFGTASFVRQYPTEFGLQTNLKDSWSSHLFYPIITSDKEGSELSRGFTKEKTIEKDPVSIKLEAGTHLWCQCGFSKNQPFCDGAHHGTQHKPIAFEVKKARTVKLCNCKLTKKGPFCDNSHLEMEY